MSAVTIRNLDHSVKLELRKRAAARGVSMEQHLRDLIMESLATPPKRRLLSVDELLPLGLEPERDFDPK